MYLEDFYRGSNNDVDTYYKLICYRMDTYLLQSLLILLNSIVNNTHRTHTSTLNISDDVVQKLLLEREITIMLNLD